MAEIDYQKGTMDTSGHESMWSSFMNGASWGGLIVLMILGYTTFTLAMGIQWAVALGLMAASGFVIGLFMGFGSAWIATVIGLVVLGVFVQGLIALFTATIWPLIS